MSRSHRDWDGDPSAGIILLCVVITAALIYLLVMIATELFRVYREYALHGGRSATALWTALVVLLGCGVLSLVLASAPATNGLGIYLLAWSFPAFIVAVELIAWIADRRRPDEQAASLQVLPTQDAWWTAA